MRKRICLVTEKIFSVLFLSLSEKISVLIISLYLLILVFSYFVYFVEIEICRSSSTGNQRGKWEVWEWKAPEDGLKTVLSYGD